VWDGLGKTVPLVPFLAQLIGVVLKEFFCSFLMDFCLWKGYLGRLGEHTTVVV